MSKYLMEEISRYYYRQHQQIDIINLRLSSVCDENLPPLKLVSPLAEWSLGSITIMSLSDAVRAFTMAVESSYKPGVRIMNTAGPLSWTAVPVAEILRNWWGDEVDLSYFEQDENQYNSVYQIDLIKQELGFLANDLPKLGF